MLSVDEFSVGYFSDALPGSLVLPRNDREEAALIGRFRDEPCAVLLSGQFVWQAFPLTGNVRWSGLIVPGVRIELDEGSLFDPAYGAPIGSIQRSGTVLTLRSKSDASTSTIQVLICDGLPPLNNHSAGFSQWQVVLGFGDQKRVLWRSHSEQDETK